MPYSRDLKDPNKREQLPFRLAKRENQQKLLSDICNKKEANVEDEEADIESDEDQYQLNLENNRNYFGA